MENAGFYDDLGKNITAQYDECESYRLLCREQNFNPHVNLKTKSDFDNVPFVVTTLFKKSHHLYSKLLRVNPEKLSKWTTSSSTTGDPSIVGRTEDDISGIRKFVEQNSKLFKPQYGYDCVFFPEPYTMRMYHSENMFGKHTESYIGNILNSFRFSDQTIFLLKKSGDEFYVDENEFVSFLKQHSNRNDPVSIRGSTSIFYDTVCKLRKNMPPFNLGPKAFVQTGGGGWDGRKGSISIGRKIGRGQFVREISEFLGIPKKNFIDTYSFTENSIPITGHYCEEYDDYLFHIPKYTAVVLRDTKTLQVLRHKGEKGFIEMLNAYGTNGYAGASVLVDDLAELVDSERCPACGCPCMTIRIIGRVTEAEAKGCGATLKVRSDLS